MLCILMMNRSVNHMFGSIALLIFLCSSKTVHGFSQHHHLAISPSHHAHITQRGISHLPTSIRRIPLCPRLLQLSNAASVDADVNNEVDNKLTEREIDESMTYLAQLIQHQLSDGASKAQVADEEEEESTSEVDSPTNGEDSESNGNGNNIAYELVKGRFIDLTTSKSGEQLLENLFSYTPTHVVFATNDENDDAISLEDDEEQPLLKINIQQIKHAIITLQSLSIYGMQIGVKGSEESQTKMIRHLFRPGDGPLPKDPSWGLYNNKQWTWNPDNIRKLKYYRDIRLGKQLLAKLIRKRTAAGAYDLLVDLGIWDKHEDTPLLRSGFPVHFTPNELRAAKEAENTTHDPDLLLRLRKDLRNQKVYTIDSASTLDIDDGVSVEVLDDDDGDDGGKNDAKRHRYWIHIADVDRWAPRGSDLLKVAERRGTSLYLPTTTLCMFPENMSSGTMSLQSWEDKYALSLGVELNDDGSINPSSIIITPSLIHADYRLTYDQVDEMLDEGVGYTEEWQIGALLAAATKRRAHRVGKGSTEGMVPFPIPKGMVTAEYSEENKQYDISLKIETSHNSGANATAGGESESDVHYDPYCSPVSSSQLIVTEMMILAGEAIGKWQQIQPVQEGSEEGCIPNKLELPFRRQPAPALKSRERETKQMDFLFAMNKRYPHAWYARRFFNKVNVSEEHGPHFGMGLDCYVQWSSPIRRITDLQVHSAVKRYLRRKRVNLMIERGVPIPSEITSMDLGYDMSKIEQQSTSSGDKQHTKVDPIDYTSGLGTIFAARPIQWSSSNYWIFEYIRRRVDNSDEEVMFESIVLGCVNQDRFQYAIYVYELGLEHRYVSEKGKLDEGRRLWLKVASVNPRQELLTFSLASRSSGIHHA